MADWRDGDLAGVMIHADAFRISADRYRERLRELRPWVLRIARHPLDGEMVKGRDAQTRRYKQTSSDAVATLRELVIEARTFFNEEELKR
jgi:hypothetical protein